MNDASSPPSAALLPPTTNAARTALQAPGPVPSWVDRDAYPFQPRTFVTAEGRMRYLDEGPRRADGPAREHGGDRREVSSARPIVIVHGTPSWSFEWRRVVRALSTEHRVIVPDHLGFGLSDKPADPAVLRPIDHARRLRALVEQLGVDDYVLVVHDFGGPIGLPLALDTSKVAAIVAINTWCWPADSRLRRMSAFVRSPIGRLLYKGLNASPRWIVPSAVGRKGAIDRRTLAHYVRVHRSWRERTSLWTLGVELAGSDGYYAALWERRGELARVPTTFVWGMKDPAFGPPYLAQWRGAMPHATAIELAGVGHFPAEEASDDVIAAIRASARRSG